MTQEYQYFRLDVLLEGKQWVGHSTTVVHHTALPRPDENGRKMRRTVTTASSIQMKEDNLVITNLIEIELRTGRVRRHVDLCNYEDSLELGKERTDTSRRSLMPNSLWVSVPSGVDFPGSS